MVDEHENEIVHRKLDIEREDPAIEIADIVADLEDTDITKLETTWDCIDDVLANVFTNPPSSEAQLEISFSYEGYRIIVEQNGNARFVRTGDLQT